MEGICSYCPFLPTFFGDPKRYPLCFRVILYWRDVVVLAGIIACVVGFAVALFQGYSFLMWSYVVAGSVLCFASKYVTYYVEAEGIRQHVIALQKYLWNLSDLYTSLATIRNDLRTDVDRFSSELAHLYSSRKDLVEAQTQCGIQWPCCINRFKKDFFVFGAYHS